MNKLEPTYLRYVYDSLHKGSLNAENASALPQGFIGLFEREFPADISSVERISVLKRLTLWALFKGAVSTHLASDVLEEDEEDTKTLIDTYSKWFNSPGPGKYILYHDRLRSYFLQKLSSHEVQTLNEKLISYLETALKNDRADEGQEYALEHLAAHMAVESQLDNNYDRLHDFVNQEEFWEKQIEISKEYKWSQQAVQYGIKEGARRHNEKNTLQSSINSVKLRNEEIENYEEIFSLIESSEFDMAIIRISNWEHAEGFRLLLYILLEILFGRLQYCYIKDDFLEEIVNQIKIKLDKANNLKEIISYEEKESDVSNNILIGTNLLAAQNLNKTGIKQKIKKEVKLVNWSDFFSQVLMYYMHVELDKRDIEFSFIWESVDQVEYKEIINHNYGRLTEQEEWLNIFRDEILLTKISLEDIISASIELIVCSIKSSQSKNFQHSLTVLGTLFEEITKKADINYYYLMSFYAYKEIYKTSLVNTINLEGFDLNKIRDAFLDVLLFDQIDQIDNFELKKSWYKHICFLFVDIDQDTIDLFEKRTLSFFKETTFLDTDLIVNTYEFSEILYVIGKRNSAFKLVQQYITPSEYITYGGADSLIEVGKSEWHAPGTPEAEQLSKISRSKSGFDHLTNILCRNPEKGESLSETNRFELVEKIVSDLFDHHPDHKDKEEILFKVAEHHVNLDETDKALSLMKRMRSKGNRSLYILIANKIAYGTDIEINKKYLNLFKLDNLLFEQEESKNVSTSLSTKLASFLPGLASDSNNSTLSIQPEEITALYEEIDYFTLNNYIQEIFKNGLSNEDFELSESYLFQSKASLGLIQLGYEDLLVDLLKILPKDRQFSNNYYYFKLSLLLFSYGRNEDALICSKKAKSPLFRYFISIKVIIELIERDKINESFDLILEFNIPILRFNLLLVFYKYLYSKDKKDSLLRILDELYETSKKQSYKQLFYSIINNVLLDYNNNNHVEYFRSKLDKEEYSAVNNEVLVKKLEIFIPKYEEMSNGLIDGNIYNYHSNADSMERMALMRKEILELELANQSRSYDLTDEGKESLRKLKEEFDANTWQNEEKIIVLETNLQEIENKFDFSYYSKYPYNTIKIGEKLLEYFNAINNEEKLKLYLSRIIQIISIDQDGDDNFSKSLDSVISILSKEDYKSQDNTALKKTALLLESETRCVSKLFKISRLYSDDTFDQFIIKNNIVVSIEIVEELLDCLKSIDVKEKSKYIVDVISKISCYDLEVKDQVLNYCLLNIDELTIDDSLILVKKISQIEHNDQNTRILIKKGLLKNELFDFDEEKVTKPALSQFIGRRLARRVQRSYTDDFVDEDTGELVSNDKIETVVNKGVVLEENHIEKIIKSGSSTIFLYKELANEKNKNFNHLLIKDLEYSKLRGKKLDTDINAFKNEVINKLKENEIDKISEFIDNHSICSYSELAITLCENKLVKEGILIAELIKEEWPVFKYESVRKLTKGGYEVDIHAIDDTKSMRSRTLSTISLNLMKKGLVSKSIDCANKIDDIYMRHDLFSKLKIALIQNNNFEITDDLKVLCDQQANLTKYQNYYTDDSVELYIYSLSSTLNLLIDRSKTDNVSKKDSHDLICKIYKLIEIYDAHDLSLGSMDVSCINYLLERYTTLKLPENESKDIIKLLDSLLDSIKWYADDTMESREKLSELGSELIDISNNLEESNICVEKAKGLFSIAKEIADKPELSFDDSDIRYNSYYPGDFYQSAVKDHQDKWIFYAELCFKLYKIFNKKGEKTQAANYLDWVFKFLDISLKDFAKKCESAIDSNGNQVEVDISAGFQDWQIRFESEVQMTSHHTARPNHILKQMFKYFIQHNDIDNFNLVIDHFSGPNSDDPFWNNFRFVSKSEIQTDLWDLIKKSRFGKIKSCFFNYILDVPDLILSKSKGEVLLPETIDYKTEQPVVNGLFCKKIFGDFTVNNEKEDSIGHINLVTPVVNRNFFLLDILSFVDLQLFEINQVIDYKKYVVISSIIDLKNNKGEEVKDLDLITEEEYLDILDSLPDENQYLSDDDPNKFVAKMGAEAIRGLLAILDIGSLSKIVQSSIVSNKKTNNILAENEILKDDWDSWWSQQEISKENLLDIICLRIIPVVPYNLRPLEKLDGDKWASADLNNFYRRLIIRNNRLKRLMEINAPEIILRNERRMLQESFEALHDEVKGKIYDLSHKHYKNLVDFYTYTLKEIVEYSDYYDKILKDATLHNNSAIKDKNIKSSNNLNICNALFISYKYHYDKDDHKTCEELLEKFSDVISGKGIDNIYATFLHEFNDQDFYRFSISAFKNLEFKRAVRFYNQNKFRLDSTKFLNEVAELIKDDSIANISYSYFLSSVPGNTNILSHYIKEGSLNIQNE